MLHPQAKRSTSSSKVSTAPMFRAMTDPIKKISWHPFPGIKRRSSKNLETYVDTINDKLGVSGLTLAPNRAYGFAIGPLTLEQTDKDLADSIKTAFDVALEKNVAVGIHFDTSHYWRFVKGADGSLLSKATGSARCARMERLEGHHSRWRPVG
jgi:hypothetical protein